MICAETASPLPPASLPARLPTVTPSARRAAGTSARRLRRRPPLVSRRGGDAPAAVAREGSGGPNRTTHRKQKADEAVGDAGHEPSFADADRLVPPAGRRPQGVPRLSRRRAQRGGVGERGERGGSARPQCEGGAEWRHLPPRRPACRRPLPVLFAPDRTSGLGQPTATHQRWAARSSGGGGRRRRGRLIGREPAPPGALRVSVLLPIGNGRHRPQPSAKCGIPRGRSRRSMSALTVRVVVAAATGDDAPVEPRGP